MEKMKFLLMYIESYGLNFFKTFFHILCLQLDKFILTKCFPTTKKQKQNILEHINNEVLIACNLAENNISSNC